MTLYMYGKKNKNKNKNYYRNNVILSLWSRSVGIYDFRVDKMLLKKVSPDRLFCHLWQYLQFAYARAIQKTGKTDFF